MDASSPGIGQDAIKLGGKTPSGPVQPDPGRVARAADDRGDLTGIEPFPAREREDVLVGPGHTAERRREVGRTAVMVGRPVRHREVGPEPVRQCQPAALATPVICQDAPGSAVQPEPGLIARRYLVKAPPGSQECLGQDVGRIVGIVGAAQGVPEQGDPVRRVHFLEPVPSLSLGGVRRR